MASTATPVQEAEHKRTQPAVPVNSEAGFMLIAVVVMAAILLIALAVAAPVIATELRHDREVESMHRAQQYVRAIQLYQRKFSGQYPASIKVLEGTNNVRYLRQQYVDPLTGKADWRLIHLGEQKTKIHVFFGQELGGTSSGLGSAAGLAAGAGASSGLGGASGTAATSSTATIGATSALTSGFSGAGITSTTGGTTGSNSSGMFGDSAGGVIVGVGPAKTGASISQPNAQASYESWEFWYDPRIEVLRQGVSITGGGVSSTSASNFGQNAVTGQSNGSSGTFGGASGAGSFGGSSNTGSGNSGVTGGSGLGGGFGFGTTPAGTASSGTSSSGTSGTSNSGSTSSGTTTGSSNANNPQ